MSFAPFSAGDVVNKRHRAHVPTDADRMACATDVANHLLAKIKKVIDDENKEGNVNFKMDAYFGIDYLRFDYTRFTPVHRFTPSHLIRAWLACESLVDYTIKYNNSDMVFELHHVEFRVLCLHRLGEDLMRHVMSFLKHT